MALFSFNYFVLSSLSILLYIYWVQGLTYQVVFNVCCAIMEVGIHLWNYQVLILKLFSRFTYIRWNLSNLNFNRTISHSLLRELFTCSRVILINILWYDLIIKTKNYDFTNNLKFHQICRHLRLLCRAKQPIRSF